MITLNHLTVFAQVPRRSSFTKAAKELDISQPSVSRRLKAVEHGREAVLVFVLVIGQKRVRDCCPEGFCQTAKFKRGWKLAVAN